MAGGGNGQNKTTLATVRCAAAAGYRAAVAVAAPQSLATSSRHCARLVRTPAVSSPEYGDAVRAELVDREYLAVLPTSDAALRALSPSMEYLLDKRLLDTYARAAGLPGPPTQAFATAAALRQSAGRLTYPVVVKPTTKRYEARRIDSGAELAQPLPDDGPVLVQPYLSGGMIAVGGVAWRGRLVAAVHQRYLRTWPVDCGGASFAVTVAPDLKLEERLVRLLTGYDGIFMAQLAEGHLLDLNPRVYGSMPLAAKAGANLVGVYCDLLKGVVPAHEPLRARPGVYYRWLEGDLKHLAHARRHGQTGLWATLAALRPRLGAAHGPESLRDPRPMLARLRYLAHQQAPVLWPGHQAQTPESASTT
ncbi:MAG: ATP-grasp domain-containing protein [Egibacteraceae bacterium]